MSENEKGAHEWIIEFRTPPNDLKRFTLVLDDALKHLNSDYEAKRQSDITLKMPVIRVAPEGLFYQWLKSKEKVGGQHKIPRLSNSRAYVEELLQFMKQL